MERCDIQGNQHPEEQKNTHMIIVRHVAGERNIIQLILKIEIQPEILKFLAEEMFTFFLSILYHNARGKYLKFGCVSFQSALKGDEEKKITTKDLSYKKCA